MRIEGKLKKFYILNAKISAINMAQACSVIEDAIARKTKIYICVCPVSTIMACREDEKALGAVNAADLVTPDGMPAVWLGRIYGHKNIRRVYGPDLMREICRISVGKGYRHYFYGCTEDVLRKLREKLNKDYAGLMIAGMYSPPFRQLTQEEDEEIVKNINNSRPDIIWVGLGSPKQDIWMFEHRNKIEAPVMVGVGAAFDFLAGTKPQAPRWMQRNGLEWLFRLGSEPRRLWKRYLIGNTLFVLLVARQVFCDFFKGRLRTRGL